MRHDLNLPPDIENRLFEYAQETGQDALHLMWAAISRFVEHEIRRDDEPEWTVELNERRCMLIKKDSAGETDIEERIELFSLQKRAEQYFDRVAGRDLETPSRLLENLLANANEADTK
jgi:hypothetical protein